MTVKYLDPYKDDPYGKLRGDKQAAYFQVSFSEAKIYTIENGYILAGYITAYSGVIRNFKPENPIEAGLCAIPIYNGEFETRQKIDGSWTSIKNQPSVYEKALALHIYENETTFLDDSKAIKGDINFIPDGMCKALDEASLKTLVSQNVTVETTSLTGILKPYTPPTVYQQRKSGNGYSRGVSLDEKMKAIKAELAAFSSNTALGESASLGALVQQVCAEHIENQEFLQYYFDTLTAIVR